MPAHDIVDNRKRKLPFVRLIGKVYEADPLECSKCKGPMRVIALESRMRQSSDASSSTWACGRRGRCNEVRHWVPRLGRCTPACRSPATRFPTSLEGRARLTWRARGLDDLPQRP